MLHELMTILQHVLQQNPLDAGKLAVGAIGCGCTTLLIKLRSRKSKSSPVHHDDLDQRSKPIVFIIVVPVRIDELLAQGHLDNHQR